MVTSVSELVAFLKRFHRDWLADPTLDPTTIPADLPAGLATIYRELGALVELDGERAPFATQDRLTPLSRLRHVDGMLEFAWENQGNWSARCPLGVADPPVYSNAADGWQPEQRGFVVVHPSLDHFLITLCLQEAVMSCHHLVALDTDLPAAQAVNIPLQPLWLNGYYVNDEPDHQFFISHDEDVMVMDWGGLWVGSPWLNVANQLDASVRSNVIN